MNGTDPPPPISTFVVRVWPKWSAERTRWHGRVEHVQSGESIALQNEQALLEFIRRFGALPTDNDKTQPIQETRGDLR